MEFVEVSEVSIPEGEVLRITETASGQVLWEEGLELPNAKWTVKEMPKRNGRYYGIGDGKASLKMMWRNYLYPTGAVIVVNKPTDSCDDFTYYSIGTPQKGLYRFADGVGYGHITKRWSRILSVSTDGRVILTTQQTDIRYQIYYLSEPYSDAGRGISIDAKEAASGSVRIIYSPERREYLVTGTNKGSFVLPEGFSSSTAISYSSDSIRRACWSSEHNMYIGASGSTGIIRETRDGKSWESVTVFKSGTVLGVEPMSGTGKLCAVSGNSGKVALSTDGKVWTEYSAPFSGGIHYAYSPDTGIFCVIDGQGGHVTKDFMSWVSIPYGTLGNRNFRDFLHVSGGIFGGHEIDSSQIYFLSTEYELL